MSQLIPDLVSILCQLNHRFQQTENVRVDDDDDDSNQIRWNGSWGSGLKGEGAWRMSSELAVPRVAVIISYFVVIPV